MSITQITVDFSDAASPRVVRAICEDDLDTIQTLNYAAPQNLPNNFVIKDKDFVIIDVGSNTITFTATVNSSGTLLTADIQDGNVNLPVVSGNVAEFQGTTGKIGDSNISAANLVTGNSNFVASGHLVLAGGANKTLSDSGALFHANTTSWGGGGTTLVVTGITGMTASSILVANIQNSFNSAFINSADPANGQFTLGFNTDPGAGTVISYMWASAAF